MERCARIDRLEEAVTLGQTARLVFADGHVEVTRVIDVVTQGGLDHAVLADGRQVVVDALVRVERP